MNTYQSNIIIIHRDIKYAKDTSLRICNSINTVNCKSFNKIYQALESSSIFEIDYFIIDYDILFENSEPSSFIQLIKRYNKDCKFFLIKTNSFYNILNNLKIDEDFSIPVFGDSDHEVSLLIGELSYRMYKKSKNLK